MGGVAALLASLERTMTFDAMKEDDSDGHQRTIIQGRWKKEIASAFKRDKEGGLPAFIPDLVRLYINTKTLFPEKVLYLKKIPTKKTYKQLVSLEFRNVQFDGSVDEKAFLFDIPPGAVPEDVTKQYMDRLTPQASTNPK
jgi:outer membrane lipoprotein-sorting protein